MRLGEALLKAGLITLEELSLALEEQKNTSNRLGDIIIEKGFVKTDQMEPFMAQYFDIPFINLKAIYKDIPKEAINAIPPELAQRFLAIPIETHDHTITVAISDPLNLSALDVLRQKTGYKIKCVLAPTKDILQAIDYCYHDLASMKDSMNSYADLDVQDVQDDDEIVEEGRFEAGDQPVVQYVKSLIIRGVNDRASDVLIQPKQYAAELRFRIDGVLYQIDPPPKVMLPAITTRVKILGGMDIAERRLPQDGRFKVKVGQSYIDIRVSSFPTIYGESIVLRLLDVSQPLHGLDSLGFDPQDLKKFQDIIRRPYGLILVTGPTGSGKTTTLYSAINEIKTSSKNIITLEDPVEYRLPFIQQTQINSNIGLTFARGLRSILRQDPDIIMVGEIRDRETAEIAIHAALTGHLVLATLHTNNAASAAVRLVNMGVEPFLLTSSLVGIIAQRLVRTICTECREPYQMKQEIIEKLGIDSTINQFYRGKGCPHCINSGYKGRQGIFEVLLPINGIRQLILDKSNQDGIQKMAEQHGMKTLWQMAIQKLEEGVTTPEEILRIAQEIEE